MRSPTPAGAASPPNLELLRTFVAAEAAPTLSAAAAARHVTKSAVSQQLKTLEAQLGVVLFEKVGRNVRATEAARALAETLRGAFATITDSVEAARETQGAVRGLVRIGAPRPFSRVWLRPRLAGVLSSHAELVVDVTFGGPSELEKAVADGALDLAVLVRAPESSAIETAPLFVETFEAVASPSYVRAHGTPRSPDEFARHRIIVFDRDLPMHAAWWRATFGQRAALRGAVVCRVASLDEMLGLAAAGVGIAVLPDYFIHEALEAGAVVRVRPHGVAKSASAATSRQARAAKNEIVLAWRRGLAGNTRVRAVRDALLAV